MIIRCPQCGHTRTVNLSKIPSSSELATCPRCKHRFRFRTLSKDLSERPDPAPVGRKNLEQPKAKSVPVKQASPPAHGEKHRSPPSVKPPKEAQPKPLVPPPNSPDIWDAVDSLHRQWQEDMERQGHILPPEAVPVTVTPPSGETDAPAGTNNSGIDVAQAPEKPARPSGVYANPWAEKEPSDDAAPLPEPIIETEEDTAGNAIEDARTEQPAESPASEDAMISEDAQPLGDQPEESTPPLEERPEEDALPEVPPEPEVQTPSQDDPKDAEEQQAVFPFVLEDIPVEERVERDMRYMNGQDDHTERTLRDLGRLDDYWGLEQNGNNDAAAAGEIPWENPAAYGWVHSFMATVRGAMFNAPAFFSRISHQGSPASGYLFFLLLGCMATVGTMIWFQAAARLLPSAVRPESLEGTPVLLILAPLVLGLVQLFIAGGIRLMVLITAPEKADFTLIFKVVSYAAAPMLLSVVPFVGPAVGGIWFLAALVLGCRHALGLSWQQAVTAPLPSALLLLGGAAWYFLY